MANSRAQVQRTRCARDAEPFQRAGWIRVESNISNNSVGEPISFMSKRKRQGG